MGTLQNQFNNALTGITFLAQQTPMWQNGKKVDEAERNAENKKKLLLASGKAAGNIHMNRNSTEVEKKAAEKTFNGYREDYEDFVTKNKQYLSREYAKVNKSQAEREHQEELRKYIEKYMKERRLRIIPAQASAQESAQARQNEIDTADNNMKSFVEQIRAMKESGAISNKQAKSMIYKAEHQEDKN